MIRHFKYTKAEVDYTPRAMNEDEQCWLCRYFQVGPRRHACNIVEGVIAAGAWCNKFETRKEK